MSRRRFGLNFWEFLIDILERVYTELLEVGFNRFPVKRFELMQLYSTCWSVPQYIHA